MNIKKLIKEIVKNEIKSILNENKTLHPLRFKQLEKIGEATKRFLEAQEEIEKLEAQIKIEKDRSTLDKLKKDKLKKEIERQIPRSTLYILIYEYITNFYEEHEAVSTLKPYTKDKLTTIWNDAIKRTKTIGQGKGWGFNDNSPAWTQFEKSSSVDPSQPRTESYKLYVTFARGKDFADFIENINKIPWLLLKINSKPTKGKVSFKVANVVVDSLLHKDNVVIHFKNNDDKSLLEAAIQETGFKEVDRESIDRTRLGVDAADKSGNHSSDSQLVTEKVIENIIINKNLLLRSLSKPSDFMQGLSGIETILSGVMKRSSHRNR